MPTVAVDPVELLTCVVELHHTGYCNRVDPVICARPERVAALAVQIGSIAWGAEFSAAKAERIQVLRQAGYLCYAMDAYGMSHEELCHRYGPPVAQVVAGLSSDLRLPAGKRARMHSSEIGQAGESSQIVKLAEILAVLEMLDSLPALTWVARSEDLRAWSEDTKPIIDALCTLRPKVVLREWLRKAMDGVSKIPSRVEEAAKKRRKQVKDEQAAAKEEGRKPLLKGTNGASLRQNAKKELGSHIPMPAAATLFGK